MNHAHAAQERNIRTVVENKSICIISLVSKSADRSKHTSDSTF